MLLLVLCCFSLSSLMLSYFLLCWWLWWWWWWWWWWLFSPCEFGLGLSFVSSSFLLAAFGLWVACDPPNQNLLNPLKCCILYLNYQFLGYNKKSEKVTRIGILDFRFRIPDFGLWIFDSAWILRKTFPSHADWGPRMCSRIIY